MGGGNVSQDQTSIICIDLKSFYASVECVERGLNPFKTNLVVADPTRSKQQSAWQSLRYEVSWHQEPVPDP